MTAQQNYAETQHDLCCSLLGLNASHNAPGETLWDRITSLLKEREELATKLQSANQRADESLLSAIKQGIAATPERVLTEEVLAAFRLPIRASQLTHICKGWPDDVQCDQYGEWFRILKA